jgi:hypothetical protein
MIFYFPENLAEKLAKIIGEKIGEKMAFRPKVS